MALLNIEQIKATPAPKAVVGMGTHGYRELVEIPRLEWGIGQIIVLREDARQRNDMDAVASWNIILDAAMRAR